MKATGVVRKIDDLGRIVIPKEIRKSYKINEGDSLEIFVDNNGVILKKFSLTDAILDISKNLVEAFYKIYKKNIIFTNREKVMCASNSYHHYIDIELTNYIKEKMEERMEVFSSNQQSITLKNKNMDSFFLCPILVDSDVVGSVILLDSNILEDDKNVIRFITTILIKNLE